MLASTWAKKGVMKSSILEEAMMSESFVEERLVVFNAKEQHS